MCFGDGFLKSQYNWYKILKKQLTPTAAHEILFSRFLSQIQHIFSLRKWPTFRDATTGFPAKWRLRNEGTNFILMTCHCRGQSSASDWLCCERNLLQPIRSTTQVWVVTRTSFRGNTRGRVVKSRLFCQVCYPDKTAGFSSVKGRQPLVKWRQPHLLNLHSTQPGTGSSADLVLLWI